MDSASRDMFSGLPDPIISHILSFLPTKEAASASVLSKRWRFLFASATNLDFKSDDNSPSFMEFVDMLLDLQGTAPLNRFSLSLTDNPDPVHVTLWILHALGRGVSDLDLRLLSEYPLPHEIFVSKTLVRLKLGEGHDVTLSADVEDVFLPKLKILDIDSVVFEEEGVGFASLLSGCPVLEELVLTNMGWENWEFCSVSVTTLKRLTIFLDDFDENPMSVAFDTPSLEYLEYSDNIAREYPKVNFSSLVEAHIGLRLSEDQSADADFSEEDGYFSEEYEEEEKEMVGNATNFLFGLCNVEILYLSAKTLEVFTFCCEATPVFNNLIQLTIESNDESGWDSLPALLPNCPNLETLIFKGLVHKRTDGCGNMCLCKPPKNPSCLSSSAVKVLKIILSVDIDDEGMEMEQIMHFLEKMPRLEQLVVYFNISYDSSVFDLSKKLQSIPRIASPKCNIQVISPNLSLSSTLPSTLSKKWSVPPNEEYSWFLKALK